MFFKKLELFGFKSFAQKTTLNFESGVTAIVGPNGCGKSNIADAIKWVLGEQSVRSMRGSSMEDVIFHGAEELAAVGFAEVSLTVANQNNLLPLDYEEITITRRIFRSGESEYLINKVPVRLKDITELMMDTGMGMRSYSLMEQGKVDQILSSRPEERRAIFEEASGITKYKTKKEEALRKLQRTQENLQRIGDIIVEVKRQIKSMERQVNRARRYQEEFAKLKEYELKVAQYQYHNLKKERNRLADQGRSLEKAEIDLTSKMEGLGSTLANTKQDLSAIEQDFSQMQARSFELTSAIQTADNKVALDRERIAELARLRQDLSAQTKLLAGKLQTIGGQIKEQEGKLAVLAQQRQEELTQLSEKQAQIGALTACVERRCKEISAERAQEVEVIAQQTRLKNELTKLQTTLANFNARLHRLNVESEKSDAELKQIEERYNLCVSSVDALKAELRQADAKFSQIKGELEVKLAHKQKLDVGLEALSNKQTSQQSQLVLLQEMTKQFVGFSQGVKSILTAIDSGRLMLDGLYGVVANIIKVGPQYQAAIEMALGENLQAIVAIDRLSALEVINYLRQTDAGRAKIICLDSLIQAKRNESGFKGSLGRAIEFVQVEPGCQKAVDYLLANIFIVDDLEHARRLMQNSNSPEIKLVTLKGEMVTKAALIGGGPVKNLDSSLLGRKERIDHLSADLARMRQERADLEQQRAGREEEIQKIRAQIEEQEPGLNRLRIQLANKETEKNNIETERKRLADEVLVIESETEETNQELKRLQQEQQKLKHQQQRLEEEQRQIQNKIQDWQNLVSQKEQIKQETLVEVARIKTQLTALERLTEDAQDRLQMIFASQSEQVQAKQTKETQQVDTTNKISQLQTEIEQLKLELSRLSGERQTLAEQLQHTARKRQRYSALIVDLEGQMRAGQKQLDEVKAKRNNFQLKLTELSYQQDGLKNRMQQNYQIDLEVSLEGVCEISPPDDAIVEAMQQLRAKLEGWGPVNLVAIEENEQLQQRYTFLIAQQQDLNSAQESLRQAITQINRTARQVFAETFAKIQVSFKEYFRILFGGGEARLILVDEHNILTSGIEIVVRPPGKKLQNISLLSGGEKALTAVALLFAIFKIKPSPFCILDEVDAPLDEANVERFTNLLAEFIKTSQFIVITHNKRTINMADIMYGITMEKSGVSKIVSVRLTEQAQLRSPQPTAPV